MGIVDEITVYSNRGEQVFVGFTYLVGVVVLLCVGGASLLSGVTGGGRVGEHLAFGLVAWVFALWFGWFADLNLRRAAYRLTFTDQTILWRSVFAQGDVPRSGATMYHSYMFAFYVLESHKNGRTQTVWVGRGRSMRKCMTSVNKGEFPEREDGAMIRTCGWVLGLVT